MVPTTVSRPPSSVDIATVRAMMTQSGRPWVLWLGSAVSYAPPSVMPGVATVMDGILDHVTASATPAGRHVHRAVTSAVHDLRSGRLAPAFERMPFEAKMGELDAHLPGFIPAFLGTAYAGDRPNDSHRAAVAMLGGLVDLIVTTNFDTCLESALAERGTAGDGVVVATPVSGSFEVPLPAILKVHGTIDQPDSIAATVGGLAIRANDPDWRESLRRALAGRSILTIGYSFSDSFDINPVLRDAVGIGTRIVHGSRSGGPPDRMGSPPEVHWLCAVELSDPNRNALLLLAGRSGVTPTTYAPDSPDRRVRGAIESAERRHPVSPASATRAVAALHYWLDNSPVAVELFSLAERLDPRTGDDLVATALVHARRYRAALRRLDGLVRSTQPSRSHEADLQVIHWLSAAGHVADSGGRVDEGARYYSNAADAIRRASLQPTDLPTDSSPTCT